MAHEQYVVTVAIDKCATSAKADAYAKKIMRRYKRDTHMDWFDIHVPARIITEELYKRFVGSEQEGYVSSDWNDWGDDGYIAAHIDADADDEDTMPEPWWIGGKWMVIFDTHS